VTVSTTARYTGRLAKGEEKNRRSPERRSRGYVQILLSLLSVSDRLCSCSLSLIPFSLYSRTEVDGNVLESGDIQCDQCQGDFLELLGQGIEEFLGDQVTSDNSQQIPTAAPAPEEENNVTNLLLPGILNQLLGVGSPNSILSQSTSANGRPIGFVVRQSAVPGDDLLSALLGRSLLSRGGNSFEDLLHHLMMNESSYANHGATEEVISRLERQTDNLHELGECSISQEPFSEGDIAIILPCHHAFKEGEILQWLHVNNTCPVCRVSIE
jgi:hypothetical protein